MTTEPELTETQRAYHVAQYELFQLAAYGHCTYHPSGELLTDEGKRQAREYHDRIHAAQTRFEAAALRLAADAINALPRDYECDPGRGDAANELRRMANETEATS